MRKALWTLNVDNYAPDITAITYPFLQAYARKCGADFNIITKREWPNAPPVYEKLQLHELGRDYDWNIYIDGDALVAPDMYDVTDHLSKDTVAHYGTDMAGIRWRYDNYLRRNGRHIGSCNWFTIASDWCLDLWKPLEDLTLEQAIANITPSVQERAAGVEASHLIDDYTLSRNIARYGLKVQTVVQLAAKLGNVGSYLWHKHMIDEPTKVKELHEMVGRFTTANLVVPVTQQAQPKILRSQASLIEDTQIHPK